VLSDPEMRREYDQVRAMGSGARFTPGGSGSAAGFEDVFGGMFGNRGGRTTYSTGGFEDLLGGMFGSGGFGTPSGGFGGASGPSKGADITAKTTLDFLTAIRGDTVTLTMQSGKETKVKIPEGVADGQKIRLKGKGQPSPDGGAAGDLVLTVAVRKHPVFEREGLNLRVDVPVTFAEAALGATIEVPTLDGAPVKLRVAPGTPSGRVLRVKGRGVTTSKGTGDLLAEVVVAVPNHLPDKAKDALEKFAAAMPAENPRADLLDRARGA
jgi:molecular chaperone DnaJ